MKQECSRGEIEAFRDGDALELKCRNCGCSERIDDYEHGQQPKKFKWEHSNRGAVFEAKCSSCGYEYKFELPFIYR